MYAIVAASKLKPGATPEVTRGVLEKLRGEPGFVSGAIAWSTDRERGRSMILFETEDAAKAALEVALGSIPADAPLEVESADVCAVITHA